MSPPKTPKITIKIPSKFIWLYKSFEGMPQNTYYELNLQLNYSCMCGICVWFVLLWLHYKVFGSALNSSFNYKKWLIICFQFFMCVYVCILQSTNTLTMTYPDKMRRVSSDKICLSTLKAKMLNIVTQSSRTYLMFNTVTWRFKTNVILLSSFYCVW